jgi:hypothetical protein
MVLALLGASFVLATAAVQPAAAAGTTYTVVPIEAGGGGTLESISCPNPEACIAVGGVENANGDPLIYTFNNGSWSSVVVPGDGLQFPTLSSIWCASLTSCIAVGGGETLTTPQTDNAFVDTLKNGTWTLTTQGLNPTGFTSTTLLSVSCLSMTSCVATGSYVDAQGNANPLFDSLSGSTWTASTLTDPTGIIGESALSIQCFSTTSCLAVGSSSPSNSTTDPLLFTLSGTTWSTAPLGVSGDYLRSLSCPSATSCLAIGYLGSGQGVTETRTNGSWTRALVPIPAGTSMNGLTGVSCPVSVTSCVAVGGLRQPASNSVSNTFVDTLSGGVWTPTTDIDPSNGYGFTEGISCPTITTCVGVGNFTVPPQGPIPMAIESALPTPKATITSESTLEVGKSITGTATDSGGPGVQSVILYYTNEATGSTGHVAATCSGCGSGDVSATWSYATSTSGPLSVGNYDITVQAVDVDNVFGPGQAATLTVVPVPTATITTASGVSALGEVIHGTASDVGGPGIQSVLLYYTNVVSNVSGVAVATCTGCGAGGTSPTWTFTLSSNGLPGIYDFTAQAVDVDSNYGSGSNEITQIVV